MQYYRKDLINKLYSQLNDIEKLLLEIQNINKKTEKLDNDIHNIRKLYNNGYLNKNEYIYLFREFRRLKKDIEGEYYIKLLEIAKKLSSLKNQIKFLEESYKLSNINIPSTILNIKNNISTIENNIRKIENNINIDIDLNKYKIAEKYILKEEENKKKKIKYKNDIDIKKIIRKEEEKPLLYRILDIIIFLSNKIFGKLSDYLLENWPELKYEVRNLLENSQINLSEKDLLSLISLSISIFVLVGLSLYLIYMNPIIFGSLIISIGFILGMIIILLYYEKINYKNDIERNLPFAIIFLASLVQSGLSLENAIKIFGSLESNNYGAISKEFRKIQLLLNAGINLTEALKTIADKTISEKFKEFLYELILTIKSGRSIIDFLLLYSQQEIIEYKNYIDRLNKSLKSFSDLYVGMVLTVPMILISMAIMLSTIAQSVFGLPLQTFLEMSVYLIIPIINIGSLIILQKFE